MAETPEKSRLIDRRQRTRAELHWPVSFAVSGTRETVQTTTHDLSSHGFYCVVNARFVPGETRYCTLTVPAHRRNGENGQLLVLSKVRIIRVELTAERGFYGIGCQIIDYRLVNSARSMEFREHPDAADATELRLNISDRNL